MGDVAKTKAAPSGSSSQLSAPGSSNNVLSGDEGSSSSTERAPVTLASLQESVKAHSEWKKYLVVDGSGAVLLGNVKPQDGEVSALLKVFDKREETMATGVVLLGEQYDVHRFHPPLVYGRRGDPLQEDGEGFAVCKVAPTSGRTLICLITYVYPTLSARAVPQLKEFCDSQLGNLS